jgi:parvulin-like peptidyl-prolyl isomerase
MRRHPRVALGPVRSDYGASAVDEARAIISEINRGGDFAKIAKDKSKDPGSKENGGDLDWVPRPVT